MAFHCFLFKYKSYDECWGEHPSIHSYLRLFFRVALFLARRLATSLGLTLEHGLQLLNRLGVLPPLYPERN